MAVDNSIRILETKRTESGSPGISLAVTVDGKSVMNAGKENISSVLPELLHHFLAKKTKENLHPLYPHVFIGSKLILLQ